MKIEVEDLTTAECGDIAITAAEGGIGYWAVLDSYDWKRWSNEDSSLGNIEVAYDFVFYTIGSVVDGDGPWQPEDITPIVIERGLRKMFEAPLDQGGWAGAQLMGTPREEWTGQIDSSMADMIIQFGVFGEIVYG